MKNTIINFIPEDLNDIHCLFKGELFDTKRYWEQNYNADDQFKIIGKIFDKAAKRQWIATHGNTKIFSYLQHREFRNFQKSNKKLLAQELAAEGINLKHQVDFYLVEFFKNINEAYRIQIKLTTLKDNDLFTAIQELTFYIKAACDCFQLWAGSAIIKRGQNMGSEHEQKKDKAIKSKGGQAKSDKFEDAKKYARVLWKKGYTNKEIASDLIEKRKKNKNKKKKFCIPGNNGKNYDSLLTMVQRWTREFKKD